MIEMKKEKKIVTIYQWITLIIYGIALITCLLCNLLINHTLTWFPIVFVSILLLCSITNVPFLTKKHRCITSLCCCTVLIYILLYVCCRYVDGNWLWTVAYPIATYTLLYVWFVFLIIKYVRLHWGFISSIVLVVSAGFILTYNPFINYVIGDKDAFASIFDFWGSMHAAINGMVSVCFLIIALVCFIKGMISNPRKR